MRRAALWTVLAVLAVPLALLAWLLATPYGLRTAVAVAERASGATLTVQGVEGTALGGDIVLRGVRYHDDTVQVSVERAALNWRPRALLRNTVLVHSLEVLGVDVLLATDAADKAVQPETQPVTLWMPLRLDVQRLRVDGLAVRDGEITLFELADADAVLLWSHSRMEVRHLRASMPEYGTWEAQARARAGSGRLHISELQLRGDAGRLDGDGTLALGAGANDLRLSWQALRYPFEGEPLVLSPDGEARLQGTWDSFTVTAALGLGSQARVDGELRYAPEQLSADLSWRNLGDFTGGAAPRWHSAAGSARLRGQPDDYGFELQGELQVDDLPGHIDAHGVGSMRGVSLQRLTAAVLGGELRASGRVDWEERVVGELAVEAEGLDPAHLVPDWPGAISGRAQLGFTLGDAATDLRFDADLDRSRLRGQDFALRARGRYDGAQLHLDAADLRSGESRLTASGDVLPPFDLRAELDSPDLGQLWPELAGRAQLDIVLRGPLQQLHVQGRGEATALRYQDVEVATLNLEGAGRQDEHMRLALSAAGVQAAGRALDTVQIDFAGRVQGHDIRVAAVAPEAALQATLRGGYDVEAQRWNGQIATLRFEPAEVGAWDLEAPVVLDFAPQSLTLEEACLSGAGGMACLQVAMDGAAVSAAFRVESLVLGYFRPLLPPDWKLEGDVDGSGRAQLDAGDLVAASLHLGTTAGAVHLAGRDVVQFLPSTVAVTERDGRIRAELNLRLPQGGVFADVTVDPGPEMAARPLQGSLRLDSPDLAFLPLLFPEVSAVRGELDADLQISGTAGQPEISGRVTLADGGLRFDTAGIELTGISVDLDASADRMLRVAARATSGGELQVAGQVNLRTLPPEAQVSVTGTDFQIMNTTEARIWVNPDLKLAFDRGITLTGDLLVPRADITPRRFTDGGIAPSADQVLIGDDLVEPEPGIPVHARVTLRLGDAVHFDGFGLTTTLEGAITAVEEPGRLTSARGELRLKGGRYQAYGQDLEIETGRLFYTGGPVVDPAVDFRAARRPRADVLVGVRVRGRLEAPEFSLFSDPAMPQDQQLAWLILGRPMETEGPGGDRAMVSNAALALGLRGGDWLAQRLGGDIGVDEISIATRPGEPADQAQLTLGKYLSPRVFVSYGVSLFQPGHSFRLRYDVGRGFSVQTETGVHSGGDLLYTIER